MWTRIEKEKRTVPSTWYNNSNNNNNNNNNNNTRTPQSTWYLLISFLLLFCLLLPYMVHLRDIILCRTLHICHRNTENNIELLATVQQAVVEPAGLPPKPDENTVAENLSETAENLSETAEKLSETTEKLSETTDKSPERTKRKIVIYSVPRSGSSFLGEMLNRRDDVFYMYEPLHTLKTFERLNLFPREEYSW